MEKSCNGNHKLENSSWTWQGNNGERVITACTECCALKIVITTDVGRNEVIVEPPTTN